MKPLLALAVALLVAGVAVGREVQITVYGDDLGLVRDVREIEPPAGGGDVSVADVDARIDHTPKDEKVRLFLGNAFDIVPERTVQARNRISDRVWEQTTEVKFRNHKKEKVTIVARDRFAGEWTIVATSLPSRKQDATTAEWLVEVDPDGETVLTYRVRVSR